MTCQKLYLSVIATLLAIASSAQASSLPLSLDPLDHHVQDDRLEVLKNETVQSNFPF
ncbi:MAG: hypothetical protein AAFY72_12660 [Cyanobacteria bacterium J06649_4]